MRVRGPLNLQDSVWNLHRVLSGIVGGCSLVAALVGWRPRRAIAVAGGLATPIACIWFHEVMAAPIGFRFIGRPPITAPSHPGVLRLVGWVLLLLPVFAAVMIQAC